MRDKLQLAIQAVRAVSKNEDGEFCYHWIDDKWKAAGVKQQHLTALTKQGVLERCYQSRGGSRVYYKEK